MKRLRALVLATKLDGTFTNADSNQAVMRWQRARDFDSGRALIRKRIDGTWQGLEMDRCSRRWLSPKGRLNIDRELRRRTWRLDLADQDASENPKLITLTYRNVAQSWLCVNGVRHFMDNLRHYCRREHRKISYIWIAELQKRAAIHIHIVVVNCPFIPWSLIQSWWSHGSTDIEAASTRKAMNYIAKYVRKSTSDGGESGELKHILFSMCKARRHGASLDVSADPTKLPMFVRDFLELYEGEAYVIDCFIDKPSDTCGLMLSSGANLVWTWSQVKWTLTTISAVFAAPT